LFAVIAGNMLAAYVKSLENYLQDSKVSTEDLITVLGSNVSVKTAREVATGVTAARISVSIRILLYDYYTDLQCR